MLMFLICICIFIRPCNRIWVKHLEILNQDTKRHGIIGFIFMTWIFFHFVHCINRIYWFFHCLKSLTRLQSWMLIVERKTIFRICLVIRRSIVVSLISLKCQFQGPPFAKCHGQNIEKCQHIVCVSKHLICFTHCEKYYVCMIVWMLLFECSVLEFMQTFSCFVNVCRSISFPQLMER